MVNLPILNVQWLPDEDWNAMAHSQAKAIQLVAAARSLLDEAKEVLRAGMWSDPQKELRHVVAFVNMAQAKPPAKEGGKPKTPA